MPSLKEAGKIALVVVGTIIVLKMARSLVAKIPVVGSMLVLN